MDTALFSVLSGIYTGHQINHDQETLSEYALALNGSITYPSAVVWPENEEQLIATVQAANKYSFEIHPVAQGRNWGYGTAQGTRSEQVIINLSRLSEVLEINEEHAYVRVQPGITQLQLHQALTNINSSLQLDITAAGSHTSVVGNLLERGFGHTDYSDRFSNVLSMRVLLPNGEIITTGMEMFPSSKAKHLYPYGIGPVLNGLFSQSNLGIVLDMTIALQPKPEYQATVMVMCRDEADAPEMVSTIAELKLKGVVTSGVHTVSMTRAVGELASKAAGAWVLTTSLAGPRSIVKARYKYFKQTIKQHLPRARVFMMDDFRWGVLCKINEHLKSPALYGLQLVIDLKKGIPSDDAIKTLLDHPEATSEMKTSEFPACFRWICAVSSFSKKDIKEMLSVCHQVFEKYGYEERYSLTNVSERAVVMIANIRFGKTEDEITKARDFHKELDNALLTAGFCPYRSGSGMFDVIEPYIAPSNLKLLNNLKQAVDPNNILSPGKYWMTGSPESGKTEPSDIMGEQAQNTEAEPVLTES